MRKILFAVLAVAACTDSNSPSAGGGSGGDGGAVSAADKQQDYDDVAASIGANLSAGDLGAMTDSINIAFGRTPAGLTVTQGDNFQQFDGARGGLTVSYHVQCRDDADAFVVCNGLENHAHIHPAYSGTIAGAAMSMDGLQRDAAWIVRDLALPTPRIGGSGTVAFASHLSTGTYQLSVMDKLGRVLFDPNPTNPLGGSGDLTITVQRTRQSATPAERSFTIAAHVVFTGGDAAMIMLDGTESYALTLSTGAVTRM